MITQTTLRHPVTLAKLDAAMRCAIGASVTSRHAVGVASIANRRGRPSIVAVYHRQPAAGLPGLEFFDSQDHDITKQVKAALRASVQGAPV